MNLNRNVSKFNSNTSNFDSNVNNRKNFNGKKKSVKKKGACPQTHSLESESLQNFFIVESSLNFNDSSGEICWIFDTAPPHHFCKNKELFSELHPIINKQM